MNESLPEDPDDERPVAAVRLEEWSVIVLEGNFTVDGCRRFRVLDASKDGKELVLTLEAVDNHG